MGRSCLGVGSVEDLHLSSEIHLLNLLQKPLLHTIRADFYPFRT